MNAVGNMLCQACIINYKALKTTVLRQVIIINDVMDHKKGSSKMLLLFWHPRQWQQVWLRHIMTKHINTNDYRILQCWFKVWKYCNSHQSELPTYIAALLLVFLWIKCSLSDLLKGIVQIIKVEVQVGMGTCVFHLLTWFGSHEASLEFSDDLCHKTTDSCFSFVLIWDGEELLNWFDSSVLHDCNNLLVIQ